MIDLTIHEIEYLEEKYGSPLYVFDEMAFIENYKAFQRTFRTYYPKYQVSYSYKTNYTPYICSVIKNLGGYAEVVSEAERYIAKRIGYKDATIIYNGPNKGTDGIEAFLSGSIVNVDHLHELEALSSEAYRHPEKTYSIGVRVNLDVGQAFISRFGMDEEDVSEAFSRVSKVPNLRITGLHCHISRCRGIDAWKKRTEIMLAYADRFFIDTPPAYIDLGSGMFGQMDEKLSSQFDHVPTYGQYAEVTAKVVAEHYSHYSDEEKPVLFTEPGTTLISKYIDLIARVDAIKQISDIPFIILNCSEHNLGETCLLKQLPMRVINRGHEARSYRNAGFVGYTCLEQDVMYKGYCGEVALGDTIQFGNVGGYSNVLKPPFIWPNCAMVARNRNGEYVLMKRRETKDDLLNTYQIGEKQC